MNYSTFEDAHIGNIKHILSNGQKIESRLGDSIDMNLTYSVDNIRSYQIPSSNNLIKLDYNYIQTFYSWVMSGSTDAQEAFKEYPTVARFIQKPKSSELPENFNTFYGPRIAFQKPFIIEELRRNPNSRRAVISILQPNDLLLLGTDETLEFPCTDSATFSIRNNKLNIHLHMRSQNMLTVVQLDIYLWSRICIEIAKELNIEPGVFSSSIVSAHIYTKDLEHIGQFLNKN